MYDLIITKKVQVNPDHPELHGGGSGRACSGGSGGARAEQVRRRVAIRQIRTVRGRVRVCDMLYCDCACVLCLQLQVSAGVEPWHVHEDTTLSGYVLQRRRHVHFLPIPRQILR